MKLGKPIQVVPGVYQLRAIGARVTALFGDDGIVLVDTGGRGSLGLIDAGLKALGASLGQVRLVVLTHCHPDHIGSVANLVEATSAKVAVHRNEASIVNGEESLPSPHRHSLVAGLTRPLLPLLLGQPVPVDYPLEDGDSLPVAQDVLAIHTPGHTAGSICLYAALPKVLIVGDAFRYRFGRLRPPTASVTQDPKQAMESLKKLVALDFDAICFGHCPPLRRDAQAALRQLVEREASQ